jgi:hypothetical protein
MENFDSVDHNIIITGIVILRADIAAILQILAVPKKP